MTELRKSRMTNEELEQCARGHRQAASQESSMSWPENSEQYAIAQDSLAEVFEELIDRRTASGEPRA